MYFQLYEKSNYYDKYVSVYFEYDMFTEINSYIN